ncbi:UTP--glucose-1-phosphate uridylyltransferase [Candidatus Peregrinibacteria bacterium RIFOXYA2_FULL_33_21]|nr:MAG: UTP--glucose-1-phosphate uridylyltransferase [Candidatus Peregrinibacteria bacterium RIFOXYA2_FULL_33_21]
MSRIKKAVLPVAGFGTRFLPFTKACPKEMLPIVDKPVIQYLVEEAVNSGIEEIILVTGRGKRAIEDHFDHSFELQYNLVEKGKQDLLKAVKDIENMAKFIYVRQPYPLGDGDAILRVQNIINGEPFLILFGDDIVDSQIPASKQLIKIYEKTNCPIIALTQIDKSESQNYGIFNPLKSNGKVHTAKGLVEKPKPKESPSNLAIIGKYIMTPDIFDALKKAPKSKDGELRLIDGMKILLQKQSIYGLELKGTRYDTGDKIGFLKATIDFALKRPELRTELKEYMKGKF